jgi:hypothetical protein
MSSPEKLQIQQVVDDGQDSDHKIKLTNTTEGDHVRSEAIGSSQYI